ncbi:hemin-degrading factor [Thalassolituus sp. LLYu03]|uniref:hemin-degrading factor n=1 Tax=Thalassolituus sp. LLYu03 TaxID=3421656 RepID=UPI003D2A139B
MNQAYQELAQRWQALLNDNPALRIRNAAALLGVSEAELLATRQGAETQTDGNVIRLNGDFKKILSEIESLGEVMALTRNDAMVHEKTGQYKNISIHGNMGLALGVIDLRIFFTRFITGFAVTEITAHGERNSLQFFDGQGEAVHKIYATANTDMAQFRALVERHAAGEQSIPVPVDAGEKTDFLSQPAALDGAALEEEWRALKDVHHFQAMLKKHGIERIPAYENVPDDLALPVAAAAFEDALTQAAATDLSIMVFVGSPGVIQIHTGTVRNLKRTGPWFNVLDPDFNLHADTTAIGSAWIVRKPTADGLVTSLEVFDTQGRQLALLFGERHNGEAEQGAWRTLANQLAERHALREESAA